MRYLLEIAVALLPVFVFLAALIFLDSYKLVKLRSVLLGLVAGSAVALVALVVNEFLWGLVGWGEVAYPRYGAPVVEELLKGIPLVVLIKKRKIGFMVDAAIYGFAIGAGFSFLENVQYLHAFHEANPFLWVIRGFGTAIMHGGTVALLGIVSKSLVDRKSSDRWIVFLPGLALAIVIHSFFNHFVFSPELSTAMIVALLPTILLVVFSQSEKATRQWLGVGFDTDQQLLEMITTGKIAETRIGLYLQSLKARFPGELVVDMLCVLRLHVELAVRAKGILLMREAGFKPPADPEVKEKFAELEYLEKNLGKTGQLAIMPFIHTSSRELWQLHMLGKK
jgi:RsiW-degrading membrane proteinase PrsW (M82 family)